MRQLRFARIADDGTQFVLETDDGSESFLLRPDVRVRDALRAAPRPGIAASNAAAPPPAVAETAPEPSIGPREIQVRIRAGESPEQLAESLGVPLTRINRFAQPVMDERLRIADEARRARARRGTPEGPTVVFGEAVDDRFTAHGVAAADVEWDSYRREDGEWVVVAQWFGSETSYTAEWIFNRTARSVTPLDDTAVDLLSDRPIRPVTPPAAQSERPSLAAAPPLLPGIVSFPPMPDAHTGPLPVLEDVFDQEAPSDGPRDVPPLVPSGEALDFDAPPLPLGITDPTTRPGAATRLSAVRNLNGRRDESDDERAARVKVPSWDDILLGVRRKQD